VDGLAATLVQRGYRALPYHAGLDDDTRKANQEAFIREEGGIIVATVAFGMGIDKSNVRFVVHGGMPKSLEHYQQESGRAGRDGLDAECVLLHGPADFNLWQRIIADSEQKGASTALEKLRGMVNFCNGATCRHREILEYFGQQYEKDSCGACDVCLGEIENMEGASETARHICGAVHALDGGFGGQYVARLLAGERDERMARYGHDGFPCFGVLAPHRAPAIRIWAEQLVAQGYLEKLGEYQTLALTRKGLDLLDGDTSAALNLVEPDHRKPRRSKARRAPEADWEGVHRDLFEALRELRREHAQAMGKPPYVIFSDRTLRDLAQKRPVSEEMLLRCHGVGQHKCNAYGALFLPLIREFCLTYSLESDVGLD
jgi:ATP-dependent DNA helicase RecQ